MKRILRCGWILLAVCVLTLTAFCVEAKALSGKGTADEPYQIGTAEDYVGFVKLMNDGHSDACAVLTQDVDLNGNSGTEYRITAEYNGTFDGCGFALKNLSVTNAADGFALFSNIGTAGMVRNLKIESIQIQTSTAGKKLAVLCYINQGRIEKCEATAITVTGKNSKQYPDSASVFAYENKGVISDCRVAASIQANNCASAIACINDGLIERCEVTGGSVSASNSTSSCAGGISAVNNGRIQHCVNRASITNAKYVGGIAGTVEAQVSHAHFFRCSNSGTISGKLDDKNGAGNAAGGIVGGYETSGAFCIEECWNTGNVSAHSHAGGISGRRSSGADTYILNCWNSGNITTTTSTKDNAGAGGITGAGGNAVVKNCLNVGKVTVKAYGAPIMVTGTTKQLIPKQNELVNCYGLEGCVVKPNGQSIIFPTYYRYDEANNAVTKGESAENMKNGTVCSALNSGSSKTIWKQGAEHPVLADEEKAEAARLTAIRITTAPTQTAYLSGEAFNPSGMVVTADYSDETTKEISGYTVTNGTNLQKGQTGVIISYTENSVTVTATQSITVTAPKYTLTVHGGSGGGAYEAGESVTITANAPADGQCFTGWDGAEHLHFTAGNASAATAVFDMPARELTLTARYADVALSEISITTPPIKTSYTVGEAFDPTGLILTAAYTDKSTKTISYADSKQSIAIANGEALTLGQSAVLLSYTENKITQSAEQSITVIAAPAAVTLSEISITNPPIKTAYTVGEAFDPTGLILTAAYTDKSTKTLSYADSKQSIAIANGEVLALGQSAVLLSYTENSITKSAEQSITVTAPKYALTLSDGRGGGSYEAGALVTITADSPAAGQAFTGWTGAENLRFISGDSSTPIAVFLMPAESLQLTAGYADSPISAVSIIASPSRTDYLAGEAFDPAGMILTITYADGRIEMLSDLAANPSVTILGGEKLSPDQTAVTVCYTESGGTLAASQFVCVTTLQYTVTVQRGAADRSSGRYDAGELVTVTANPPAEGQSFIRWESTEKLDFTTGSAATPTAVFRMPAKSIHLTAVYTPSPLRSLSILNQPRHTDYTAGEDFDPAGMALLAAYADETLQVLTNLSADPRITIPDGKGLTASQSAVTIRYTENGVTKAVSQPIAVYALEKRLFALTVRRGGGGGSYPYRTPVTITADLPTAEQFFTGWTASAEVTYVSGDASALSAVILMPPRDVTLTAHYAAIELVDIAVAAPPKRTAYLAGERFDPTGLCLTAAYTDGSVRSISDPSLYTVLDGDPLAAGRAFVTIVYMENEFTRTVRIPVQVHELPQTGDRTPLTLWVVMIALSGMGMGFAEWRFRRL